MLSIKGMIGGTLLISLLTSGAYSQTYLSECFRPASSDTPVIQQEARQGPYRIALVNGFAGNDWRINMIQAAKAWSKIPENAADLKEFKVVSTGNDVSAQIATVDSLIAAGYDGIVLNAVNPTSFGPVLRRAKEAGTVIVPFDNVLDVEGIVQVNESQVELGRTKAETVAALVTKENPKFLEVRGLPGNSVDRDNHDGMREVLDKIPGAQVVEVVGNWDTGTVQKVVADAIATSGPFDGIVCQHGCAGAVRAMVDSGHPIVPLGADAENGTRQIMVEHKVPGVSAAQAPAMSSIALSAIVAQLKGEALPSLIFLPIPSATADQLEDGKNYFSKLPATFYAETAFEGCPIKLTADDILAQNPDDS